MAQYDGSIRINTDISVKSAEKQLKTLENNMSKTAEKVASLRDKMDALRSVNIPTDEYKEVQKQISSTEAKLNGLITRQEKFLETGGKEKSSTYKRMEYEAEQLRNTLEFAKADMQDLVDSGKAFTLGSSAEEYARLGQQLKYAENSLEVMNQQHQILEDKLNVANQKRDAERQKIEEAAAEEERLAQLRENAIVGNQHIVETLERIKELEKEIADLKAAGITEGYRDYDDRIRELEQLKQEVRDYNNGVDDTKKNYGKLGQIAKSVFLKISNLMGKLTKSTKKNNNLISATGMSFKNIIRYGLGIRSLYALFGKLRSGVKEGFQNLAQYSSQTNTDISMLISSLLQLKNSLATAFAPILTVIAPILKNFISLLSQAATYVSHLMSALTGKSTYIRAKEVQEDYAASLNKTSKAAKKAIKYLSGLDEIRTFPEEDEDNSGLNPTDMFETLEVENSMKEFADNMRNNLIDIFNVFKQAWEEKGKSVMESAKATLQSLIDIAKNVGATLYNVFTEGTGLTWVESSLDLLRTILDIIHVIADAFSKAWNNKAGIENITALFNMFTNINSLLSAIGDSFIRVFSNDIGVKIWTNILGIITGVYNIVGNLAKQLEIAWNTAGTGDRIWEGILNIINTILETIHNIVDSTAEWARKLDFTPLLKSIADLFKALQPLTKNIGAGLEWFWNNVLLPIAGWTIQEAVPTFLNMLSVAIDLVNDVIEVLKPLGTWLWENFLQPLGAWAGEVIIGAMETITKLLKKLGDWIVKHQEALQKFIAIAAPIAAAIILISNAVKIVSSVIGILKVALTALTNPIGLVIVAIAALAAGFVYLYENCEPFRNLIDGLIEAIGELIEAAKEIIPGIIEGIKEGWNNFIDWLKGLWQEIVDTFKDVLGIHSPSKVMAEMGTYLMQGLINGISSLVDKVISIFQNIKNKITDVWNSLKQTTSTVWNGIKTTISGIWNGIKSTASTVFNGVGTVISTAWNTIKTTSSNIWNGIKSTLVTTWNTLQNNASNIFNGIRTNTINVFDNLKSRVLNIWDDMVNGIQKAVNKVKEAVNSIKNKVSSGFSNAFGGREVNISQGRSYSLNSIVPDIPIPHLATGTVIPPNKEFLAVLGDQKRGTNIEAPLSTIEEAVENAFRKYQNSSNNGGTYVFTGKINRRVLFEEIIDEAKLRQTVNGRNPFELV